MARLITRMGLGGLAVAVAGLNGCAGTYDLVTSERFKERPFHTLFAREDPLEILETSDEGDARARAMRNLKEPKRHGGTDAQQDKVLAILQTSATTEPRPLCRLEAVAALGRFEDPRAADILVAAYRNASGDKPTTGIATAGGFSGSSFTPDTVTTIQCMALKALAGRRNESAKKLLIEVARMPTEPKQPSAVEQAGALVPTGGASETDRLDVRLEAIQSLGRYEKDEVAVRALVNLLRTEKDIAVRGQVHLALIEATGKDLPIDAQAWVDWLDKPERR